MGEKQADEKRPASGGVRKGSDESREFSITMDCIGDYEFRVRFDKESYGTMSMDEGPPLGRDRAPDASRILAAAVGNCLSASLLFCARKARVEVPGVHTKVKVSYTRNEQGRLRIGKIDVEIHPQIQSADLSKAQRCLELFEDYCVVTQSVRSGVDVAVSVQPSTVGA